MAAARRQTTLAAALLTASVAATLSACGTPPSSDPGAARLRPTSHHTTQPTRTATTTTSTLPSVTPTTVVAPVTSPPGWASPLTALPPGGGFTSLSCLSDTFCIAVGGGDNQADADDTGGAGLSDSWDGAAWADPSVYFPTPATGTASAPIMPAISCTGGPLCLIVDGTDHVSSGDGTDWSTPISLSPGPGLATNPADPGPGHPGSRHAAVSCPTPSFCAVVDNTGHAAVLRDGGWSTTQSFGAGGAAGRFALRARHGRALVPVGVVVHGCRGNDRPGLGRRGLDGESPVVGPAPERLHRGGGFLSLYRPLLGGQRTGRGHGNARAARGRRP